MKLCFQKILIAFNDVICEIHKNIGTRKNNHFYIIYIYIYTLSRYVILESSSPLEL